MDPATLRFDAERPLKKCACDGVCGVLAWEGPCDRGDSVGVPGTAGGECEWECGECADGVLGGAESLASTFPLFIAPFTAGALASPRTSGATIRLRPPLAGVREKRDILLPPPADPRTGVLGGGIS